MAAKVHPRVPDGWVSDGPYHAHSDTRHKGRQAGRQADGQDRQIDRETPRQHFDDFSHEGPLLICCTRL